MATRPDTQKKGVGEGRGTTSSGVHYDTRLDGGNPQDAQQMRGEAKKKERKAARAVKRKLFLDRHRQQMREWALKGVVIALFTFVMIRYGEPLWRMVEAPTPQEAAEAERYAAIVERNAQEVVLLQPAETETVKAKAEKTITPVLEETRQPTTTPVAVNVEAFVWIPASGSRYHKTDACSGMKDAREVPVAQAVESGLTPCKRCKPPESGVIE